MTIVVPIWLLWFGGLLLLPVVLFLAWVGFHFLWSTRNGLY